MQPLKTPGPDGLHALLYQKHWGLLGDDLTKFLNQLWDGKRDMRLINHNHITLILKVQEPDDMKNLRPISLCNVNYKILSKALVLRLKSSLNSLVSFNQSAFIPGRLIIDNVLIAHELFLSIRSRLTGKKGNKTLCHHIFLY